MKRFFFALLPGIFFCLNFGCQSPNAKTTTGVHSAMELNVEPGEHWQSTMKIFIFNKKKSPQIAAWIEDSDGNYIATIAISEKSAKGNWMSAPKEGRPEALPVWSHKQQNYLATTLDAVSSATIKGSFGANIDRTSLVDGNSYNVYLEINHSFDYNDHWTKDNSGVNGQPSLVYQTQFIAGQPGRIPLVPIGHGSADGSDGNIINGLENFTSALSIVKSAYVTGK